MGVGGGEFIITGITKANITVDDAKGEIEFQQPQKQEDNNLLAAIDPIKRLLQTPMEFSLPSIPKQRLLRLHNF